MVLKRLYNLSDEQMEYQLLDRMSYQRFCLLQDAMNVPDRNTIWRFGEPIGVDGAAAYCLVWTPSCTGMSSLLGVAKPLMPHWFLHQWSTSARLTEQS